jgi:hypothetical protein
MEGCGGVLAAIARLQSYTAPLYRGLTPIASEQDVPSRSAFKALIDWVPGR